MTWIRTVGDLKRALAAFPDDLEVCVQAIEEDDGGEGFGTDFTGGIQSAELGEDCDGNEFLMLDCGSRPDLGGA